jgi:osmotically-inducible protein OsmY
MASIARASENGNDCCGTRPQTIGRQAEERIRQSSYLALRHITCDANGDVLHLRGRVPSHYLKQVAQEIAAGIEGAREVINRIEVVPPPGRIPDGQRLSLDRSF